MSLILSYTVCLFESIMLYLVIGALFPLKKQRYMMAQQLGFVLGYTSLSILVMSMANPQKYIIPFLFVGIVNLFFYQGKWNAKMFFGILIYYEYVLSNVVVTSIFCILSKHTLGDILTGNYRFVYYIIAQTCKVVFVILTILLFQRIETNIRAKYWIIMDLIVVTFTVMTQSFVFIHRNAEFTVENHMEISFFYLCFLTTTLFVIYLFSEMCGFYQMEQLRYTIEVKNEAIEKQFLFQGNKIKELRKIKHDIKNTLLEIGYLLSRNKKEEAIQFIENAVVNIDSIHATVNSGNIVLDALINYETITCMDKNIPLEVKITEVPSMTVSNNVLSDILIHLFENAYESCALLEAKSRSIDLEFFEYQNYFIMNMKNTYHKKYLIELGFMKKFRHNHKIYSFRMSQIKEIANKNNGFFQCKYEEKHFISTVMLPIQ